MLGPVLFFLYIFDLPTSLKDCEIHLYADDFKKYMAPGAALMSPADIVDVVYGDLGRLHQWCVRNGLMLNPKKTLVFCISSDAQKREILKLNISALIVLAIQYNLKFF